MTTQEIIESATKWMEDTAKSPKHGYDQIYRWGQKGDYDCSAAVITAWDQAGVDLKNDGKDKTGTWPKKGGANTTRDMMRVMLTNGFEDVTVKVDLNTGKGLKRGDVLLDIGHHVAMYSGNGNEVEASINEKGTATGGKPGDQTGKEFKIRPYHNRWDKVLRYVGIAIEKTKSADSKPISNPDHIHFKVIAKTGLNIRKKPDGQIIKAFPYETEVSFDDDAKAVSGWTAVDKYKVPNGNWKPLNGYCSSKWLKKV